MNYKTESLLKRFINWVGNLVLNLVVIGLVLLVAIQFILTNPNLKESIIAKLPYVQQALELKEDNKFSQTAKTVFAPQKKHIAFQIKGDLSSKQVKLLINGNVVGDFASGSLKVTVEPGDKLAIDAREYEPGIWLEITDVSASLNSFQTGQQFWIKEQYKSLNIVKINNKI
jgi:hypothetical protein